MTVCATDSNPCPSGDFEFWAGESKILNIHIDMIDPSSGLEKSFDLTNYVDSISTTVAVLSNNAILPQAVLNIASTTGFASSGSIAVDTKSNGLQIITYTGITGTTFTGCTGGTGILFTAGSVTPYGTGHPKIEEIIPGISGRVLAAALGNPKDGNITLKFSVTISSAASSGQVILWLTDANGNPVAAKTMTNVKKLG